MDRAQATRILGGESSMTATAHDPDELIRAGTLRNYCGGITDMTLFRWVKAEILPAPIVINRIRFWRRGDVIDAMNKRRAESSK